MINILNKKQYFYFFLILTSNIFYMCLEASETDFLSNWKDPSEAYKNWSNYDKDEAIDKKITETLNKINNAKTLYEDSKDKDIFATAMKRLFAHAYAYNKLINDDEKKLINKKQIDKIATIWSDIIPNINFVDIDLIRVNEKILDRTTQKMVDHVTEMYVPKTNVFKLDNYFEGVSTIHNFIKELAFKPFKSNSEEYLDTKGNRISKSFTLNTNYSELVPFLFSVLGTYLTVNSTVNFLKRGLKINNNKRTNNKKQKNSHSLLYNYIEYFPALVTGLMLPIYVKHLTPRGISSNKID
jgi:hypothetical protein